MKMERDEARSSHGGDVGPVAAAAIVAIGIGIAVTTAVATAAAVRENGSGSEECRAERGAAGLLAAVNGAFLLLLAPGVALCRGSGGCSAAKSALVVLTYGALALVGIACLAAPVIATVMFSMGVCTAGAVHGTVVAAIAIAWCTLAGGGATVVALVCRAVHTARIDFALASIDDV
jgi:hypothetical protein